MPLYHEFALKAIHEAVTQMNVIAVDLLTGNAVKNVFLELWKEGL
jgi:hypothetical protein